ncbi:unnamed protein product [Phytomonas sp. Hart1]|nr:unnamed protein product [Phytomonas sp. Hart1]|eukprot:CCW70584.1 unnamed protein product [Phytomonas sp. isolate Hart1]
MQSSDEVTECVKEWDVSAPGAGAQRVIAITQLYFRLCNFLPITIVVADALCLVFGPDGASKLDLVNYLALSEERVQLGLDTIPLDMRCTSLNLSTEDTTKDESSSNRHKLNKEELRYFLNYKRILPFVYSHVSQILLALCTTLLPSNTLHGNISRTAHDYSSSPVLRTLPQKSAIDHSQTSATIPQGGTTSFSLSDGIRRRKASEGIFCPVCRTYYGLDEFAKSASRCMGCKTDVLRVIVEATKDRMNAKYEQDGSIVSLPSLATRQKVELAGAPEASPTAPDSPSVKYSRSAADPLPELRSCPLARDPFLVQQSLAFLYLYNTPFACINDCRYIVNAEEIMTEPEYEKRLEGKATVSDQFRAAHRNPNTIRVRFISQREVEKAIREENEKKISKRAHLPPWLLQRHHFTSLSPRQPHGTASSDIVKENPKTASTMLQSSLDQIPLQHQESGDSTLKKKDANCKRTRQIVEFGSETREDLIRDAHFVASEFFHGDFIPIKLPLYHTSTS